MPDAKLRSRRVVVVAATLVGIGVLTAATIALGNRGKSGGSEASTDETDGSTVTTVDPEWLDPPGGTAPPLTDSPIVPAGEIGNGLTAADLGCIENRSAEAIDGLLRERLGPSLGLDNPHVYQVDDDQYLWVFHDAFLDYSGKSKNMLDSTYLQNVAMLQSGLCFQLIHRGTLQHPTPFEQGSDLEAGQYLWPLGGEVGADGRLYVFWSKMQEDEQPRRLNGIKRHPVETWLGVYDRTTLRKLAFEPAPNPGVEPQYGSAAQTSGRYTYLFGNSNLHNLTYEGGCCEGPYSATREYLARVPAGEFSAEPEYYDGSGWSSDADDAEPISERFRFANGMQPRLIDGRWYSVVKPDEFWGRGHRIVIDVADRPWGPWKTVYDEELPEVLPVGVDRETAESYNLVSYFPVLLPWRAPNDHLVVVVSYNGQWSKAVRDPRAYRPRAFDLPVPS